VTALTSLGKILEVRVELEDVVPLRFADSSPVRAASAIAVLGRGWLVAQDDDTHGCWLVDGVGTPLRLFPPVEGLESFSESAGTKHLKPDVEAALEVPADGASSVLLLGSGSTPARMRAVLVDLLEGDPRPTVADLAPLYAAVTRALDIPADQLNLEGACLVGDRLRWFNRGLPTAGLPSASVDLDVSAVLAAARGGTTTLDVLDMRRLDLGQVQGVGLAVTDAVSLGGEQVLVSAAAEDSPNTYDDGPVVASALVVVDGDGVRATAPLPEVDGRVAKVEGLSLLDWDGTQGRVLAVVDADDPSVPSSMLWLRVSLDS
jgi:hypothetical protein